MMQVFLFGGGMGSDPNPLNTFIGGLHPAFILACLISLVAAASAAQSAHHRQARRPWARTGGAWRSMHPGQARSIASLRSSSIRAYAIERKGGTI